MSQLGKAYIEVKADLKKFPAELRAQLKAALAAGLAGVEFTGLEEKAKQSGEKAADALGDSFERRGKHRLARAGESGGRSLLGGIRKIFSRDSGDGRSFLAGIGDFFGNITQSLQGALSSAGSSLASAGSGITSSLGGALGGGGDISSLVKVGAIAVLIPVAVALAGALFQLGAALFALPAAAGVAVAAILPMVIAFQGFGEAVSAGLSGDTEKFDAALKKLAPSARTVVKELVALGPQFKALKNDVQGAFFRPLQGFFTEFGRTLLPLARVGLTQVAVTLGDVARELLGVFTAAPNLAIIRQIFDSTSSVVADLGTGIVSLTQAFLSLIGPALPFIEQIAGAFRRWAFDVNEWVAKISGDGRLAGWLSRAADIGKKLIELFKQAGIFIGTILNSVGDEGTDTIRGMADAFKDLNKYLKSPAGLEFLHNLGVLVHWAGNAVVFFIKAIQGSALAINVTFAAFRLLRDALEALGGAVWIAIKAIGSFFVMVWGWITSAGRAIGDFFTKTIPEWFNKIVDFFASLPGRIQQAVSGLQHTLRDWFVGLLQSWYEGILFKVGQVIGIFLSLPQLIPMALSSLGQALSSAWDSAWAFVVTGVTNSINNLVTFFSSIPGVLSGAASSIWNWAVDLWTRVTDSTWSIITSGWDRVTSFFSSIPDRIRSFGPALLNAAIWLGHKIGEGLSNIGSFASDIGNKIVNTIKSGVNWVIDSINRGIASIDDQLPGSLPRIPRLAKGAVVDSPTLALVGEAGPEVVVPLGDPRRAQQLAEQSGLLKMLRGAGGGTTVNVVAYLDPTSVLIPVVRTVVDDSLDQQGGELPYARAA